MFLIKTRILYVRFSTLMSQKNHDRRSSYFGCVPVWVWRWVLYKSLTSHPHTLKRWCEFFCESLNVRSSIDRKLIDQIQVPILSRIEEHRQNVQPSIDEVRKAMNQMQSRKAPGSDEVTADIMKAGGEPVIRWLFKLCTDV